MNKAHVIGKRIVGILQCRVTADDGTRIWHIQEIYLDNGTTLVLGVTDLDCEHAISITAWPNSYDLPQFQRKPRGKRLRRADDQEGD